MNFSIWYCFVLYCCGTVTIERLAERAELPLSILVQAKNTDNWDFKKSQFLKLSPKEKISLHILELLFGEFQSDENKVAFIQKIIDALKGKKTSKVVPVDSVDNLAHILPDELSIQDKLDYINNSYKHLMLSYNGLAKYQKILEDTIGFYADEIRALKVSRGQSSNFDEIERRLHTLSYNIQALSRLIQL
ncbi:hypothetical protein [Nostoc sp.]